MNNPSQKGAPSRDVLVTELAQARKQIKALKSGLRDEALIKPPHNDEAERSLIGAIFLENKLLDELMDEVLADMFYRESHRHIYRAMIELHKRGDAVDVVTVADHLSSDHLLDAVGGPNELARLSSEIPSATNAPYYSAIVTRKDRLRQFIEGGRKFVKIASEDVTDVDEFFTDVRQWVERVGEPEEKDELCWGKEGAKAVFNEAEATYKGEDDLTLRGHTVGIKTIDEFFDDGLFVPGEVVIIGGRPAMGKSAIAGTFAAHLAMDMGKRVLIESLEMKSNQWYRRMLYARSGLSRAAIKNRTVSRKTWEKFVRETGLLVNAQIAIDYKPGADIARVRRHVKKLAEMPGGLDVVFIDYLQLMRNKGMRASASEVEIISENSRRLKEIAGEFDCCIVALAQPNRKCEDRTDKRPWMSDLKGSGQIEQDADIISFVYRDEVYDPESEHAGIMELIVRKFREGQIGTMRLFFDGMTGRIADLDVMHGADLRAERVRQVEKASNVIHLEVVQDDNDWI